MNVDDRAWAQIDRINLFIGGHPSEGVNSRLIDYRQRIEARLEQIERRDMAVAFIGKIGAGKTSAICKMTDLRTYDVRTGVWHDVLKTGAGRTTVCEVRVREADRMRLCITPLNNEEILRIVSNFADFIWAKANHNISEEAEGGNMLSQEITRSIRNMLGLTVETRKNVDGRLVSSDKALELAKSCSSLEELRDSMSGCLNLERRTQILLEPISDEVMAQKDWLREVFAKVNDGKMDSVSIPALIEVEGPLGLVRSGMSWTVIDTRGIDSNVSRQDIRELMDSDRVIPLICSSFADAPDANARAVVDMAISLGLKERLQRDGVLFVLDRDESCNVADIPEEIDNKSERRYFGRDIRRQQVQDVLAASIQLSPAPEILFFDSRSDAPDELWAMLDCKYQDLQSKRRSEILDLVDAAEELITAEESRTKAFEAALNEYFYKWRQRADKNFPRWDSFGFALKKKFSRVHHRTLAASIDRRGGFESFNFYEEISQSVRTEAVKVCRAELENVRGFLGGLRGDYPEFDRRISAIDEAVVQQMRDFCQRAGDLARKEWFDILPKESVLWTRMIRQWGRGNGYVLRVQDIFDEWLAEEKACQLHEGIIRVITARWGRVLADRSEA